MSFTPQPIYLPLDSPVTDPKTGLMARVWVLYQQQFTGVVQTLQGQGPVIAGTHADRLVVPPSSLPPSTLWFETDRSVAYLGGTSWSYAFGTMIGARVDAPTDLTEDDANFVYLVSDFGHVVRWTGTVWTFDYSDDGNGYFQDFAVMPGLDWWTLCNGSAVTYLIPGPTLGVGLFTTPDCAGTPLYSKSGAAYDGTPTTGGGNLTGAGAVDPAHITVLRYFRR